MGLFSRSSKSEKEVKLSKELCDRRDALGGSWPQVKAAWDSIDQAEVMPAAATLSVALLTANAERIFESREKLKLAIWKRNAVKADHQREMEKFNAEIETINGPVIFAKAQEWQLELSNLRTQRIVESVKKFTDMGPEKTPRKVKYLSNFSVISEAKEVLLEAIRQIREMRQKELAEVHQFIETTEQKLKKLDFSVLKETKEAVSESVYQQIIQQPELVVVQPGREKYLGVQGLPVGLPGARVGRA